MDNKIPNEVIISGDEIADFLKSMRDLAEVEIELTNQIKIINRKLDNISLGAKTPKALFAESDFNAAVNPIASQKTKTLCPADSSGKIIFFPGVYEYNTGFKTRWPEVFTPILALPGDSLPDYIPDYRPILQRDGLILLAWDKRITEMGDRYTAYWVTSIGTPRFYASKPLSSIELPSARPDHKSYAAEDGIEFYGQEAPEYMVHVAPELMMSNPRHGELRQIHIDKLKYQGSKVNFNYKYLLKTEKPRGLPPKKHDHNGPRNKAS